MSTPPGLDGPKLLRGQLVVAVLVVLGIAGFFALWTFLSDLANLPRLLIALCAPPAVIAVLFGVYLLVFRPRA